MSTATVPIIGGQDYDLACRNLAAFVKQQADDAASALGFGWTARPDAPSTYVDLQEAFATSKRDKAPLPVSSLFCDRVIYPSDIDNYRLRFWHDSLHVQTGLTFALDDELELGLHHLAIADRAGIKKYSLEWRMLRVDMLGQNYLQGICGRFPVDQREFVVNCLTMGLDEGVLTEARRK